MARFKKRKFKIKKLCRRIPKKEINTLGQSQEGLGAVGGMVQAFNKNAAVDSSAQEQQLADIQNQPLGANSRESFWHRIYSMLILIFLLRIYNLKLLVEN